MEPAELLLIPQKTPRSESALEPGDFLLVLGDRENLRNATKI